MIKLLGTQSQLSPDGLEILLLITGNNFSDSIIGMRLENSVLSTLTIKHISEQVFK